MTPEQMQARSQQKLAQINDLMKLLHVRCEVRERITPDGFIEKIIFYTDDEVYPSLSPEATGEKVPEEPKPETKEEAKEISTDDAGKAS